MIAGRHAAREAPAGPFDHATVWYGMVWYGTVRYGMVWYGIV